MIQKLQNKIGIEVFELKSRRLFFQLFLSIAEEQTKGIAIAGDGLGTGITLRDEAPAKNLGSMWKDSFPSRFYS